MHHIEQLESRQFLSVAPAPVMRPAGAGPAAIVKKPAKKPAPTFNGSYFGGTTNDWDDSAVVLIISNQTKNSLYLRFSIFREHYAGTFTGTVIPGKQFDVKRKVHGGTMDFKGYVSADGLEFKGRIKSNYYKFIGEAKFTLERVI